MKKILAITLLSLLAFAPLAFGEVTFTPSVRVSTTYDSLSDSSTINTMTMDGRAYLTIAGKAESDTGFFVAGQGQPMAQVDGTFAMDDAWFQFGSSSYNLKIGRFEALEFLGTGGEDILIVSAGGPTKYQGNYARGRTNGGFALDFNASDSVLVELAGVYGGGASFQGIDQNKYGVRPGIQFTMGTITLKGGADLYFESPKDSDLDGTTSKIGFGGQANIALDKLTVNVGAASGKVEQKDYVVSGATIAKTDVTTTSVIGYVVMPIGDSQKFGAGAGYTKTDKPDVNEVYGYGTYEFQLLEGAWAKLCASYAKVKDGDSDFGARLRFDYAY